MSGFIAGNSSKSIDSEFFHLPLVGFEDQMMLVGEETSAVIPCLLNLNFCSCITSRRYFWCPKLIPPPSFNAHIPPLDKGIGPSLNTWESFSVSTIAVKLIAEEL